MKYDVIYNNTFNAITGTNTGIIRHLGEDLNTAIEIVKQNIDCGFYRNAMIIDFYGKIVFTY